MDFSATEIFVEIFVVGVLLAFSVSPLIIYFSPGARERKGILPIDGWKELKPTIILAAALLYATGIAGNRLIEHTYTKWAVGGITKDMDSDATELTVRDHSEMARDWVERHKTYLKVSRAASFSALLFFVFMLGYDIATRKDHYVRYSWKHFVATLLFAVFCFQAYRSEAYHYRCHLSEYCELIKKANASSTCGHVQGHSAFAPCP